MATLREPNREDQQLAQYLLGQLSDDESDHIDERSIAEDGVAWRLRGIEDDLVDAYVTGELSGEALQRFKWFYLSSERRRDRVRFAETFMQVADRAVGDALWRQARRGVFQRWPGPLAWSVCAAAALLLLGCGALLQQGIQLRRDLHQTRADIVALSQRAHELQQRLDRQRAAATYAAHDLVRAKASLADSIDRDTSAEDHTDKTVASSASPATPIGPVALVLTPQVRDGGSPATVAVAPQAAQVSIQLQLEFDDFPRYRVALENPSDDRVIWRSTRLTARSRHGRSMLGIVVPAQILKQQQYALRVVGLASVGDNEIVGHYVFRVLRL